MIDITKITCDQFTGYQVVVPMQDPMHIAIWLSGYYNGKRGNTMLDTTRFKTNVDKLVEYCVRNPRTPVMDAVETALNPESR
jgi:acid stress chaperone HdeB